MLMALATSAWTLAELARLPNDGNKCELINGELHHRVRWFAPTAQRWSLI